jgi:hypothetical protein
MYLFLKYTLLFILLCFASNTLLQAAEDDQSLNAQQQRITESQIATEAWLALLDKGEYGQSWDQASLIFRNTITKDEWIKAMGKLRKPLGNLISRTILDIRTATNPKGLPVGEYMVFVYHSSFSNRSSANELVTLVQENNGQWKVLTYQAS